MAEMIQIIAETEGIRTPKKRRTREDVQKAFESFTEKKAAKKASGSTKAGKSAKERKTATPKPTPAKDVDARSTDARVTKVAPKYAEPVPMNFISPDGYVREAAFDPKTSMFYIGFAKSTWAMPSTQAEWDAFEAAVADPEVNIDAYYRRAFRGRTGDMLAVRSEVTK